MQSAYLVLFVAVLVAVTIAAAMVLGSFLLGPRKPTRFKVSTYECGMTPVGTARERFPVRFYMVAMAFIIFDVEIVFLYPWAVVFAQGSRPEKLYLLAVAAFFVAVLVVSFLYEMAVRALDWSPEDDSVSVVSEGAEKSLQPRPPIRFGNENSGPVRLPTGRGAAS